MGGKGTERTGGGGEGRRGKGEGTGREGREGDGEEGRGDGKGRNSSSPPMFTSRWRHWLLLCLLSD